MYKEAYQQRSPGSRGPGTPSPNLASLPGVALPRPSGKLLRAVSYRRVSSDEQVEGLSLDTQAQRCAAFAQAKDWQFVGDYVDPGISGTTANRLGLQRLLADAKAGKFDVVVCFKLDRLARKQLLALQLIADLDACGVGFVSTTESFDTASSFGRAGLGMATTFAQLERDLITERTRAGREARQALGGWAGGYPPYGYDYDLQTKGVTVNEKEADVVRLIFREFTTRQVGLRQVAKLLNDQGIPPRGRARGWYSQAIRAVLVSDSYTGKHKTGTICPILVEKTTFEEARRRLAGNKHLHPPRTAPWLLQGRMRCGLCGAMLHCSYSHKSRYYECPRRRASALAGVGEVCTLPRFRAGELEAMVGSHLTEQLKDLGKAHAMVANQIAILQERLTTMEAALKPVEQQLTEVEAKLGKLAEVYSLGDMNRERYLRLRADATGERERLEAQWDALDPVALSKLQFVRDQLESWVEAMEDINGARTDEWCDRIYAETGVDPLWPTGWPQRGVLPLLRFSALGDWGNVSQRIERLQVRVTVYPDRLQIDGLMPLGKVQVGASESSPSCR